MPLADQAGAVARPLQQRRQGRMLWRQADLGVTRQGLLKPQPVLVPAGYQRDACGGADGGIGVALKEAHSSRGDAVNIWRSEVAASVTGHVGVAEAVGAYAPMPPAASAAVPRAVLHRRVRRVTPD